MNERLVENWLDSASERSYQAAFCQMLSAEGHRILHTARHGNLELGKDVVTIAPDGTLCAYQLKGNPDGRLSLVEFRKIQDQLHQLVHTTLKIGKRKGPHRSFLVTNGLIEEEVRQCIEDMNEKNIQDGLPNRRLEYLQRGDLLDMARHLGYALWPTQFSQLRLLLQMLIDEGDGELSPERIHHILAPILGLEEGESKRLGRNEVKRRITSAGILIAVALKNFEEQDNHCALIKAWTLYAAYAVACCERNDVQMSRRIKQAINIARSEAFYHLCELAKEACSKKVLTQGDPRTDAAFYQGRMTLIMGLLSLLWFWAKEEGWPENDLQDRVEAFLKAHKTEGYLWGEGAIPQLLMHIWYAGEAEYDVRIESNIEHLLTAVLRDPKEEGDEGLFSPYWSFEQVMRHILDPIFGIGKDELRHETPGTYSYFSEALFHLLVRTGRKRKCKAVWEDFTRGVCVEFRPKFKWQYCLWRSDEGEYRRTQPPLTRQWEDVQEEARSVGLELVPEGLANDRFLLALFVIFFPFRATPEVIRHLAYVFDGTWFIKEGPILKH